MSHAAKKGKRVPLNMRTTQALRDKVEMAAYESGRSLVQEVEARVEASFRGRPAITPGRPKRSSFHTRLRAGTKKEIEAKAKISGRSLSGEIEFLLVQSLRDKDALIKELGGELTYAALRLLGSAAALIQVQTKKSASDDYSTKVKIAHAWERIISGWEVEMAEKNNDEV